MAQNIKVPSIQWRATTSFPVPGSHFLQAPTVIGFFFMGLGLPCLPYPPEALLLFIGYVNERSASRVASVQVALSQNGCAVNAGITVFLFLVLGLGGRVSCMAGKCSTTELPS